MSSWFYVFLAFNLLALNWHNGAEAAPTEETSSFMDMIDLASKMIAIQNPQMGHMIRKVRNTVENVDFEDLKSNCMTIDMIFQCINSLKAPINELCEAAQALQALF